MTGESRLQRQWNTGRLLAAFVVAVPMLAQWSPGSAGAIYYTSGPVGIGTMTPGAPLHVQGQDNVDALRISGTNSNKFLVVKPEVSPNTTQLLYWNGGGAGNLAFEGNVGIGTTAPSLPLTVKLATVGGFGGIKLENDTSGTSGQGAGLLYPSPTNVHTAYAGRLGLVSWANGVTGTGSKGITFSMEGASEGPQDIRFISGNTLAGTLMTIQQGGNVGIGTTLPTAPLHLKTADSYFLKLEATNPQARLYGVGTSAADGAFLLDDITGGARRVTISTTGNVGIGTTSPAHTLHVAGTIGAQEVIVSATGADYVFEPTYHLQPLSEVASFIRENHHLPNIPPASDAQAKGMNVGEMQTKLLAKIEELTLHMIDADKAIRELKEENAELRKRFPKGRGK